MCLTDPPYNVSYEGKTEDELTIDNDSMENDLFRVFLRQVFTNMFAVLKDGAPAYIFHADSEGENFRAAFREAGFKFAQCCIWVKNSIVMGRQDYQWKLSLVCMAGNRVLLILGAVTADSLPSGTSTGRRKAPCIRQ